MQKIFIQNQGKRNRRGFSLIELSIVLLVIALLVGGIMLGQNMLLQASKRRMVGEVDMYSKAFHLFTDKFKQIPGDFTEAESFWGADNNCPTTAYNTVTKRATCDGDGDGRIHGSEVDATQVYERYRAWQHLSNAGMLDKKFSGVAQNGDPTALYQASIPVSELDGGYTLLYDIQPADSGEKFQMSGRHILDYGKVDQDCNGGASTAECSTHDPVISPRDALEIDAKIDDGRPGKGKVMGRPTTSTHNPGCTDSGNHLTAKYTDSSEIVCGLMIDVGS